MPTYIVATDLSARGDRAIDRAAMLARQHGARLVIVHIFDADLPEEVAAPMRAKALERLEGFRNEVAAGGEVDCTARVESGDISVDIHDVAEEEGAELLILGMHRARPFLDMFRETTLERLVRLGRHPILVVRDPAQKPYAKALVALDFSPGARRAASLAKDLAPQAERRGFHAVHVPFQSITDARGEAIDTRFYLDAAEAELAAWARSEETSAIAAETDVVEGPVHSVLDREVEKHSPDLLALGAHGRTGKAPFLLGSFANDLMRGAPCDLLIARP